MTPRWVEAILSSRILEIAARVLFTFPFWGSGLAKLLNFSAGMAEMSQFGLEPAWLFNSLTILVQLVGSALIILKRGTWFGAGMLGVFTFLTIPIVHAFWRLDGERAIVAFHTAGEHMGMIGALVLISILATRPRPDASAAATQNPDLGVRLLQR
ncbi:MAG TPA: DoxX family protein [Microvirga sp.]|nr:DoxX family protein [Microvirga sp.]